MRRLPRFVGEAAWLSVATLGANLILLAALPILSRLYGPSEFGGYALASAVAAVFAGAAMLRLDVAILSASSRRSANRLVAAACAVLPFTALAAAVTSILLAPGGSSMPAASLLAVGTGALVASAGLAQALRYWSISIGTIRPVMVATWANAVARAGGQVALAMPLGGTTALIAGECLGRLTAVTLFVHGQMRRLRRLPALVLRLPGTLREHGRFVAFGTPSALLDAMGYALLVPVVAHAFGATEAGLVAMAVRLLSLPGQIVSVNLGDTLQRELAARSAAGSGGATRFLRSWVLRLLAVGVVVIGPIAVLGDRYAGPLLGDQWAELGIVMPWLAVHWTLAFAIAPVSRVLLVGDGQRQKLAYDVVAAVLPVGLLLWQAGSGLSAAVAAYSVGHVVAYALYWVLIDGCARRLDRRGC